MRPKLASPSRPLPGAATGAVQPDVSEPVTEARPARRDGRKANLLRISRRGARRVLAPIPSRCNAAIADATVLTLEVPVIGWPSGRLYHNNAHRPHVWPKPSVVERLRSVHWMDDDILGDHGSVVAASGTARPDGGRRRDARTGRQEQRQAISLVRVAALHNQCTHRLYCRHEHVRRDQTRYENTGCDHSDNDVCERRRRAHGNLVHRERLGSEPVSAFNASYGAGVPAFASMAEAQSAMALASAKLSHLAVIMATWGGLASTGRLDVADRVDCRGLFAFRSPDACAA